MSQNPESPTTWISIADAAILLKVRPSTVIRRIEKGTLPGRTPPDMPFTYDGNPNYEVRLGALPQRLQYKYQYSHLPEEDICAVDLVSPRSSLGNIWICGVPRLHKTIYSSNRFDYYCSLISRLDEYEMKGMRRADAGEYIEMVSKEENVTFTYPAQQALITTALNSGIGGINAFTTIIGRCITVARAQYYNTPGHSIPDKSKCIRAEVPGDVPYPGARLILTLPTTPNPVRIDEQMVSEMQSEYKSHFPKVKSSSKSAKLSFENSE